jgi:hypothetical protein
MNTAPFELYCAPYMLGVDRETCLVWLFPLECVLFSYSSSAVVF